MNSAFSQHLQQELQAIEDAGLTKSEAILTTPQSARVGLLTEGRPGPPSVNLCANNYLGLANHPEILEAAMEGLRSHGYGMASVRFICGTQDLHRQLESKISEFLGTEDTVLYPSCFDANAGLFETLLGPEDAVISDALNHASIIDGIRLSKARRYRYRNNDLDDLETTIQTARNEGARYILISTDGVFSMDGTISQLDQICSLARRYEAMVHFDDCHATGFLGDSGRGTHEYRHCENQFLLTTGTLGKALGGASGGYTSGCKEAIALLRQRSRPYLFSNTLAPPIVAGALKVFELMQRSGELRKTLMENTRYFRAALKTAGLEILDGEHPIVPIMLGEASVASEFARRMQQRAVLVVAFSFPVVPQGQARIRTQVSAAHTREDLEFAIEQFSAVQRELGLG